MDAASRSGPRAPGELVRVAVDAMGGDHAPAEVVIGALEWARDHPETEVILVGHEPVIRKHLAGELPAHVSIVQASESVGMDEQPALAVRRKRDASINVCMRLVREGHADAVVTAGHTGAGVAAAILGLKRLPGVDRPALAVQMLTQRGPLVLLDIGATTDSTGHNLAQYARMGAIYAERVLGVREPTVALLSIGEEAGKGEQRVQEATELLAGSDLRFVGNCEGRDLPSHPADVVVCDASVGNVTIKFFEGLSSFIFDLLRAEFQRLPWGPLGYFFMRPAIGRIRHRFDYEQVGGAPLLGVRGTVLITHGRARRRMIGYAVGVGAAAARARIPELIADALVRHKEDVLPAGRTASREAALLADGAG
ncbi:MAG TPA: phosphate acyltransferase PlsX [Candidatus Limnocylindrales bacterium]|nr:phosphate acyltransferase PlsX [Candidatus Limnocylindrales bacterium]